MPHQRTSLSYINKLPNQHPHSRSSVKCHINTLHQHTFDMTGSSVLTWLRIALENNNNSNDNNNNSNANDSDSHNNGQHKDGCVERTNNSTNASTSTSTSTSTSVHTNARPHISLISLIDRKGHEKVIDERNSTKASSPSITITEQSSTLGMEEGVNTDSTGVGEEKKKLTVINMMGGEKEAYGYRIALMRFSTWQADMAPQRRHWDGKNTPN